MHTYYEIKELLKKELDGIVKKGELSAGSLETIDKLLNSIKNTYKITMYEQYSEDGYSRNGDSYSYRHRDDMGRYTRDGYPSGGTRRSGYSYDDGKVEMLKEMLHESSSDDERRVINKLIRRLEA